MRVLLDTHVFLWWLADSPRLSEAARRHIETADEVYVSSASLWEMAIKIRLGKLQADLAEVAAQITANGFVELPVLATHTLPLLALPDLHRDPFDRLLVAQAMSEPLHLLTADPVLAGYSPLVEVV